MEEISQNKLQEIKFKNYSDNLKRLREEEAHERMLKKKLKPLMAFLKTLQNMQLFYNQNVKYLLKLFPILRFWTK